MTTKQFIEKAIEGGMNKTEVAKGYNAIALGYKGKEKVFGMSNLYHKRIIGMSKYKGKILDVGCGSGNLLRLLKRGELHGIDISEEFCRVARQRVPRAAIRTGDVEYLPYTDNYFDYVFMTAVLEHMEDFSIALKEVQRVLKKGGTFVMSVPNRDWLRYDFYEVRRKKFQPHDDHFFRYDEIHALLSKYFTVDKYKGSDCLYYYGWKHRIEQVIAFFIPPLYKKMKQHIFKCTYEKANS